MHMTLNDKEHYLTMYMERMGATASKEAMRIPISQIPTVSSSAHVGSPLAFPWPKTWEGEKFRDKIWLDT